MDARLRSGSGSSIAAVACSLALLAFLALLVSGPGHRLGLWTFGTGFALLRWAAYLGIAAVLVALAGLLMPRARRSPAAVAGEPARTTLRRSHAGNWLLAAALLVGAVVAAVPLYWLQVAGSAPPIHDITTDTDDPPAFVAVAPLRAQAPNLADYGGAEVAAAQRQAYPEIGPTRLPVAPADAWQRALRAARDMGWELVGEDQAAGRIEATATTRWFGFRDDVVVRVRPDGTGSRIDVRSVSRVGQGDVGTNARRIEAYQARLIAQG